MIYISAFQTEKRARGEHAPLEVAVLKGRTSEFSLKGEIVSTEILTVVVSTALIVGLFVLTIVALYRRRLAAAALAAAATCAVVHIVFISLAWEGAASMRGEESAAMPPISSLPTGIYDAPAWAAVAFLVTGAIGGVVHQIRLRRRREDIKRYFEHLLGLYEAEGK